MDSIIIDVYKYLLSCDSSSANNIYYGMELFYNSFDDGLAFLKNTMQKLIQSGNYEDIDKVNDICKKIRIIQSELSHVLDVAATLNAEITDEKDQNISYEEEIDNSLYMKSEIIDYSQYVVDTNKKHSLDEDYEHKRPCGYMVNGRRYEADNWQDVLVNLCSILAKENNGLLQSFVESPRFKGRKIKYFANVHVPKKNKKIPGTEVYVWINMSANGIKNLIRKILIEFGIKPSTFYIYLRADYSSLHTEDMKQENSEQALAVASGMKIGKYVRNKIRELSDKHFNFSDEDLSDLLSKEKTRQIFGIRLPFFKRIDINKNLDVQRKDHTGNYRYWKDVYYFNGQYFLVCSQWFEYNRERFDKWISKLENSN